MQTLPSTLFPISFNVSLHLGKSELPIGTMNHASVMVQKSPLDERGNWVNQNTLEAVLKFPKMTLSNDIVNMLRLLNHSTIVDVAMTTGMQSPGLIADAVKNGLVVTTSTSIGLTYLGRLIWLYHFWIPSCPPSEECIVDDHTAPSTFARLFTINDEALLAAFVSKTSLVVDDMLDDGDTFFWPIRMVKKDLLEARTYTATETIEENAKIRQAVKRFMPQAISSMTITRPTREEVLALHDLREATLEATIECYQGITGDALSPLYECLTADEKDALAFASNVKNVPIGVPQCLESYYCFFPKELWDGKTLRGTFWKQKLPNLFAFKLIETAVTSESMYRLTKLGNLLLRGLPTEEPSPPFLVVRRMTADEKKGLLDFAWKLQTPCEENAEPALVGCLGRLRDLALVSDYAGDLKLTYRGREVVDFLLSTRPDEAGQAVG